MESIDRMKFFEYENEPNLFSGSMLYPKEFDTAFRAYLRSVYLFKEGRIGRDQVVLKNADEIRRLLHNKSAEILKNHFQKLGMDYSQDESRREVSKLEKTFYKKFDRKEEFIKVDNPFQILEIAREQGLKIS